MPVKFFITPDPGMDVKLDEIIAFGEGLNILHMLCMERINPTLKPGGSALFFKTIGFLRKAGYEIYKVEDFTEVTPLFPTYTAIIKEKEQLMTQIKQHLASIATAIADVDLTKHDLRRYKEYMDYFSKLKKGKELIKQGNVEEGKKLFKEADQTLRAIFIDQVDVHTGETVALKLIAPRWPTIISDFMRLEDEDTTPEKIKEKYKISEAEGVVLATKNKLYLEWRDRLFGPAVEERFKNLVKLIEMRKKSVEEYKNMVKPILSRYRAIRETREIAGPRLQTVAALRPGAVSSMVDRVLMYAWRPISPKGFGKGTRVMFEPIRAGLPTNIIKGVGFFDDEIEEIKNYLRKRVERGQQLSSEELLFLEKERLESLPIEPSIDNIVRRGIELIEKSYPGVKFDIIDLFSTRLNLLSKFKEYTSITTAESWPFSPYYAFLEIPFERVYGRLPNGAEFEDLTLDLKVYLRTQNMIILQYLELKAIERTEENFIKQMLGEMGVDFKDIDEIIAEELGEKLEKKKIEIKRSHYLFTQKIKKYLRDFLYNFGIQSENLTNIGFYEHHTSKFIQNYIIPEVINVFKNIVNMYKKSFNVPV